MSQHTDHLVKFICQLNYNDIPPNVVNRCEWLFLDWLGSTLAGKAQHPTPLFEQFAKHAGPNAGKSEVLTNRSTTSAYFACMVNAAAANVMEQNDLHNASVLHPGTVVFPVVLALAQSMGCSGREMILAAVTGYEAGIRVGEYMGQHHYYTFHTTGTVGTLAAAVAAGKLLKLDYTKMVNVLGNAGTQAAGLWEFMQDGADSRPLHTAKAAANGLLAAEMAAAGLAGAKNILEGPRGLAAGLGGDGDPGALSDRLGSRWALLETSLKIHAACRHTHPSIDALLTGMKKHGLDADDIMHVKAGVHRAAYDLLTEPRPPATVDQAKFSMPSVLGLTAIYGDAGIETFRDHALRCPRVQSFRSRVAMTVSPRIDAAYPREWHGEVTITTKGRQTLHVTVDNPRGDPKNPLSLQEIEQKFHRLATFSCGSSPQEADNLIHWAKSLRSVPVVSYLVPSQ